MSHMFLEITAEDKRHLPWMFHQINYDIAVSEFLWCLKYSETTDARHEETTTELLVQQLQPSVSAPLTAATLPRDAPYSSLLREVERVTSKCAHLREDIMLCLWLLDRIPHGETLVHKMTQIRFTWRGVPIFQVIQHVTTADADGEDLLRKQLRSEWWTLSLDLYVLRTCWLRRCEGRSLITRFVTLAVTCTCIAGVLLHVFGTSLNK